MQPPTANVNAALANGRQQQSNLNQESQNAQNQYNSSVNNANNEMNLANRANAGIQNGGDLYGQNLTTQENALGFNPASVGQSANMLTAVQNQVANAPNAAQQAGNYYGTSAGGTTNIYSGLMNNLNPALTNATNNMANQTQLYGAAQNAANQQAGLSVASQNNAATQANQTYSNAVAQMNAAQQAMTSIATTASQQGYYTAQAAAAYQNAYSNYISAQAAASQAASAAEVAPSTVALNQAQAKYYGTNPTTPSSSGSSVPSLTLSGSMPTASTPIIVNGSTGASGNINQGGSVNL